MQQVQNTIWRSPVCECGAESGAYGSKNNSQFLDESISLKKNEQIMFFCFEIIKRECDKFNVRLYRQDNPPNAQTTHYIDYNNPVKRVDFLYNLALSGIVLAEHCFKTFFSLHGYIVESWLNRSDLQVCTISDGPAVEYVALLLQLREYLNGKRFRFPIKKLTVLSKYGAWRNSVGFVHDVLLEDALLGLAAYAPLDVETIQFDPSVSVGNLPKNVRNPISGADVIVVMKPVGVYQNESFEENVMKLCETVKPGAVLLCLETNPVVDLFTAILWDHFGTLLQGPERHGISCKIGSYDKYKEIYGSGPVASARCYFFAWTKYSDDSAGSESSGSSMYLERSRVQDDWRNLSEQNAVDRYGEPVEKTQLNSDPVKVTQQEKNCLRNDKLVDRSSQTQECSVSVDKSVQVVLENVNSFGKLVNSSTQTQGDVSVDKSVQVNVENENCRAGLELVGKSSEIQEGTALSSFGGERSRSYCQCNSHLLGCSESMSVCSRCNLTTSNQCRSCNEDRVPDNISLFRHEDSISPKLVLDLDSLDNDTVFQITSLLLRRKRNLHSDESVSESDS